MTLLKNREVKYQDEIKAAYYTQSQITMHPIVTYYQTEKGTVHESSIVISEDKTHDYHAVHHFEELVDEHIAEQLERVLNETLTKRNFFLVKTGEINRKRSETGVKPNPQSRKIHQILSTDENYAIQTRSLAFFCKNCNAGDHNNCINKRYTESF